jgi:hydrophobe/amphiphile efflux-1 (HAE1) family protein
MNLRIFIDRPVLSIVISIVIVLMGVISLTGLPVEQYPDMAPPTIQVYANYPGANAETVQKSVIIPLEESINGVEGMNYITSTASNSGDVQINIFFKQGTNADMAAVNVQNRVSTAQSLLPAEVVRIGVTTMKQQNAELKTFALYSPEGKYSRQFLNNYMKINVEPRIKRIAGVGQVMQFGSNYSMRIWMKPDKMAQYKLIPSDITAVLEKQNIEAATGSFGENYDNTYQYTMKYRGRYSTPEEFGQLVIRSLPGGNVLRLKEVADIELGDEAYNYTTEVNGLPGAISMVYQTAGSNASEIINEIDATLEEISRTMPKGMEFVTLSDTNRFLYASISEVIKTLLEAILLVILVVYVFWQDIRSTLIPTIAIFVSIIGTFAFMAIAGFSINLLTLFALVLAIGTVVDDAIVVVEAVQARFDVGYHSSYMATNDAIKGISSAILTSTLIFMAVFIPVSMMGGTSGTFYTQFGITMAVAVGISAVNAFTLSPALCALLLRPYKDEYGNTKNNFAARFRKAFNAAFEVMTQKYMRVVLLFIKRRWLMWGTLATAMILLVILVRTTKTGLIPDEDTGTVMISMSAKPGSSLQQNQRITEKVNEYLKQIPEIEYRAGVTGYSLTGSGPSMSMHFLALKHWDERQEKEQSAKDVINKIYRFAPEIQDAQIYAMTPPMIPGYGMGSGFELYLQDKSSGDLNAFKNVADRFVQELNQRPEIEMAYSAFETNYPQYWVDIDAAQCEQAGISTNEILETLSGYYGGSYVSNFNRFSKLYRVQIQADPKYRVTSESLNHIYVRVGEKMAPLSQFVKLTKTYGPQDVSRFNLYNSIAISGSPATGYSSGDALSAVKETAEKVLPNNYGYEFGGISREENTTTNNVVIIFGICLLLIYLILSALYESFLIPFAIILSVPCGLMGSFLFAKLFGLENNIYMQTGIIMLIGLLAKTAILLTEYATKRREAGMSLVQAAYSAAKIRLRPILMTALTMVFGLLPMMVASGVGANGSRSLASSAVGGMLIGTLALLFLVPALFIVFQYLQEKFKPIQSSQKEADWTIQAELEQLDTKTTND